MSSPEDESVLEIISFAEKSLTSSEDTRRYNYYAVVMQCISLFRGSIRSIKKELNWLKSAEQHDSKQPSD